MSFKCIKSAHKSPAMSPNCSQTLLFHYFIIINIIFRVFDNKISRKTRRKMPAIIFGYPFCAIIYVLMFGIQIQFGLCRQQKKKQHTQFYGKCHLSLYLLVRKVFAQNCWLGLIQPTVIIMAL